MTKVDALGFSATDLLNAVAEKRVRVQTHPTAPLSIFNYTEEIQYLNKWDTVTMACRGLILDDEFNIVARPWKKFFNLGQQDNEIDWHAPVEVSDKLDGSLGILYRTGPGVTKMDGTFLPGECAIATRGSFASEQAIHATKLWEDEYAMYHDFNELIDEYTFLFEIIYPDNRIVVNYGLMDDLVLLGAVHKERGWYIGPDEANHMLGWMGPVAEVFNYPTFADAVSAPDREGKEGYVIRSGTKIVKLKQVDYLELHRIVTNLSPRTIWDAIANGKTVSDICADIPDEFHKYVKDIGYSMLDKATNIRMDAIVAFQSILFKLVADGVSPEDSNYRAKFAKYATKLPEKKFLFLLLDNKSIDSVAWIEVKPRGDEPLVKEK